MHFEVFVGMAIIQQYKQVYINARHLMYCDSIILLRFRSAIMDAQLDASEILNLFTGMVGRPTNELVLECTISCNK